MCLNNAILFDEAANDEADRHSKMMQEERKKPKGLREILVEYGHMKESEVESQR